MPALSSFSYLDNKLNNLRAHNRAVQDFRRADFHQPYLAIENNLDFSTRLPDVSVMQPYNASEDAGPPIEQTIAERDHHPIFGPGSRCQVCALTDALWSCVECGLQFCDEHARLWHNPDTFRKDHRLFPATGQDARVHRAQVFDSEVENASRYGGFTDRTSRSVRDLSAPNTSRLGRASQREDFALGEYTNDGVWVSRATKPTKDHGEIKILDNPTRPPVFRPNETSNLHYASSALTGRYESSIRCEPMVNDTVYSARYDNVNKHRSAEPSAYYTGSRVEAGGVGRELGSGFGGYVSSGLDYRSSRISLAQDVRKYMSSNNGARYDYL